MKRFNYTRLWEVLKSSGDLPRTSKELDEYLDEFIVELHNYCRTEKNIAERTRSLDYARSELLVAELRIGESNPTTWVLKIVRSAVYFIECEMRIITMESEHPERFISFSDGSGPLARWNGTIAELLEYTIPLQIAGRLSANSGEPLSYTDAVKLVEQIFGITISAPYDRKTKLLSRKKNDTPFLDKMRVVFREEAEKLHR